MKRHAWLLLIILLTCTTAVSADEDVQTAIEKRQEACIEKDPSTVGMCECADKAFKEWDRELNRAYKKLMPLLNKEEQQALKTSQRSWLKFRDLEFDNIANVYSKMEGTMYRPMHIESRIRIVRERALQLNRYIDLLTEGG